MLNEKWILQNLANMVSFWRYDTMASPEDIKSDQDASANKYLGIVKVLLEDQVEKVAVLHFRIVI